MHLDWKLLWFCFALNSVATNLELKLQMWGKKDGDITKDQGYKSDMNSVPHFAAVFLCGSRQVASLRHCSHLANGKIVHQLFAQVDLPLL